VGLDEDELPMFLRLRDGILHPEKIDADAIVDFDARRRVMDATGQEIYDYFGGIIAQRERQPANDIITRFLAAEIDGDRLSHNDILDICFLFLIAGLDTVSDSLTCFYAFLAQHPEHRRQIAEDPAVIPAAVEELLRWESPVAGGVPRVAQQDVELPGGQYVRFDRGKNPHIAFGGGVHRCLGSHLARRELRITLREWHRRIPDYHLKSGHEELEYPPGLRHVKDLTLAWGT
jgi:cytochrome P450